MNEAYWLNGETMSKKNTDCPCTSPGCPRHGDCDACRAYHHGRGQKTSCEKQGK